MNGMVNASKLLIYVVRNDQPKMLIGLDQKVSSRHQDFSKSSAWRQIIGLIDSLLLRDY